ncbi:hypothetical protein XA68_12030 [Ophiocordyceps unilateralis]|uniref:Uncharacterized protein n=1 Tax=Ophiocordyceps unilateralis TaxID=268505 RepID=A0A2A9PEC5_OPHUN|nr:hypothetical protein XA68_12030 [Ophiocordyceps unilateralis]
MLTLSRPPALCDLPAAGSVDSRFLSVPKRSGGRIAIRRRVPARSLSGCTVLVAGDHSSRLHRLAHASNRAKSLSGQGGE